MTRDLAATAIGLLTRRGLTIATAESLTGGLVASALTTVPGSSAVFRGGIVAYTADLKSSLLEVPAALLDAVGTIHQDVAKAMAAGARQRLGAAVGVATTGVAGPDAAEGHPVGTVHIAVSTPDGTVHRELALRGDRDQIRTETVRQALELLLSAIAGKRDPVPGKLGTDYSVTGSGLAQLAGHALVATAVLSARAGTVGV